MRALMFGAWLVLSLYPVIAAAQPQQWPPAVIQPVSPTASDVINATFTVYNSCLGELESIEVTPDNVVRAFVRLGCIVGPPPISSSVGIEFGPLPQGTYTLEIYLARPDDPYELRSRQPLVVSPPVVPALSPFALGAFAAVLALAALLAMQRA